MCIAFAPLWLLDLFSRGCRVVRVRLKAVFFAEPICMRVYRFGCLDECFEVPQIFLK